MGKGERDRRPLNTQANLSDLSRRNHELYPRRRSPRDERFGPLRSLKELGFALKNYYATPMRKR
jgi:hypothetical protein